jgi:hypothetical protein
MSETDAFFTQTIVGAPMSVLLGRQFSQPVDLGSEGLQIDLASGADMLSPGWRSWIITTQACAPVGIPRMRPTRYRRWLERYALVIAAVGLLSCLITAVYWSLTSWR